MRFPLSLMIMAGAVALAGCSQKGLRDIRSTGTGPDEFLVLPSKPLTAPENYSSLPVPTPGGANATDATPQADAVVALGGNAAALAPGAGIPASEAALVSASTRYGIDPNVRVELAEEKAAFLKRKRITGSIKLFPVDRYEQIYSRETLDPFAANSQFRAIGASTPSAPPRGEE